MSVDIVLTPSHMFHLDRYDELKPTGVRFVYRANNNRLSNDLEPEYVAVDEENNKAYVCLQVR